MDIDLRRPDLLTLRVSDLSRSLDFYHGVLGLPVKLRTEHHAELQTDTMLLTLLRDPTREVSHASSPTLGWEVGDLDAAVARLEGLGVSVTEGPRERSGFGLRAGFRDPDGHLLEVVQLEVPR